MVKGPFVQEPLTRADTRRRDLAREVRQPLSWWHDRFEEAGVERAYVLFENGHFDLSHPSLLAPVRAFFEVSKDFARHEAVFIGREPGVPTLFFAFVHDTRRGLAQGGLRYAAYDDLGRVLVDGLRLAQGMTRKNALAGLWWGGGKGILPVTPAIESLGYRELGSAERRRLFEAYGRFIASLGGVYYTAEDVGTKTADMNAILSCNRFVTCISREVGGSGNPSPFTARGVLRGMQAAWRFLEGSDDLRNVKVAVQGVGNVGSPLVGFLYELGAEVWVTDVDQEALDAIQKRFPSVHRVSVPDEIFDLDVDILAPCALGNQVNAQTIPRLRARLVCGAANNILGEPEDAERLRHRDIAFVPDYLCNRMGITNCADEWQGYLAEDVELAAERVYPDTLRVLKHAQSLVVTSTRAADELADIAATELQPMIGHRGRRIIDHLVASGWAERHEDRSSSVSLGREVFYPARDETRVRLEYEVQRSAGGNGLAVAAAPITAGEYPSLASFLSPILMDIRARNLEAESGRHCRRVVGSDHGGLALQLSVERSLPWERERVGRPAFLEHCHDSHERNDAAIREQLHRVGVAFDPRAWLDPMNEEGSAAVRRLYHALDDAGWIEEELRPGFRCPRCETVRVASDLERTRIEKPARYTIIFRSVDGKEIETRTFFPELLSGAVALVVRPGGVYGDAVGSVAVNPLDAQPIPVVATDDLETDAEFLVPTYSVTDFDRAKRHGIAPGPQVLDASGRVEVPGHGRMPREEARYAVLSLLGGGVRSEEGRWQLAERRCSRCKSIVDPLYSMQLFLRLDFATEELRQAMRSGAVRFNDERWRQRVERRLEGLDPLCISRQQWWGNELPDRPEEVLSTWFSLLAWSLQAAGWPRNFTPVDEVLVSPELLVQWLVPSQLVALGLTGRPAYRKTVVHGTLHTVERRLDVLRTLAGDTRDEEAHLFRTFTVPIRSRSGHEIQPETLVRRFGADALRLGLLLCHTERSPEIVTLSESALRQARHVLPRLLSKVAGLYKILVDNGEPEDTATLADLWIMECSARKVTEVIPLYEAARWAQLGQHFVEAVDDVGRYTQAAVELRRQSRKGREQEALSILLRNLEKAFSPIAPHTFAMIRHWSAQRRLPDPVGTPPSEKWLDELMIGLSKFRRGVSVQVATPDRSWAARIEGLETELTTLSQVEVNLTARPSRGTVKAAGPFVLVLPGDLDLPPAVDTDALRWYCSLHSAD